MSYKVWRRRDSCFIKVRIFLYNYMIISVIFLVLIASVELTICLCLQTIIMKTKSLIDEKQSSINKNNKKYLVITLKK